MGREFSVAATVLTELREGCAGILLRGSSPGREKGT